MARSEVMAVSLVATLIILLPRSVSAEPVRGQSLTLGLGLTAVYDDNLLQLSDAQIADFESGAHPDRYSITTAEDGVFSPTVALVWQLDAAGDRRHVARFRWQGNYHAENATADHDAVSIGWREMWSRDRRLSLGYYTLPNYYLRQLFDEDATVPFPGLSKYRRAQFDLQIASVGWTQRITHRTLVEVGYQFERRDYVHEFNERDSDLHQGAVGLRWNALPRHSALGIDGGYRQSAASAADGDEVAGVSDSVDVSYDGYNFGANVRTELLRSRRSRRWRLAADALYGYEARHYTSARPADRYHYGRDDQLNTFEIGVRASSRHGWSARAFWRVEDNLAQLGGKAPLTSDSGSYHQNVLGGSLDWSRVVWRSTSKGAEEGEGE